MKTTRYTTGRNYGAPQVLEITAPANASDDLDFVPVQFTDAVRGISGTVKVLGFYLSDIGPAVLTEYDAGRYTLA